MEENKDMVTEEIESTGEIKIADEVVATVVGIAAMEIDGVAGPDSQTACMNCSARKILLRA